MNTNVTPCYNGGFVIEFILSMLAVICVFFTPPLRVRSGVDRIENHPLAAGTVPGLTSVRVTLYPRFRKACASF